MTSAKTPSAIDVRIDDVGSILPFLIGFPFGKDSAGFCKSVWLPRSILNFRIGSISSIGGLIAATLFADTVSACEKLDLQRDARVGTEKVPQRNCVTKILPNVRVNILVRFASKPFSTGW